MHTSVPYPNHHRNTPTLSQTPIERNEMFFYMHHSKPLTNLWHFSTGD